MAMILTRHKNIKPISYLFVLILTVMTINSCTDGFDALNTPDDRLSTANLDASNLGQAFAHVQYTSSGGSTFQTSENLFADLYAQYFSQTSANFQSDNFVEVGSWTNATWNRQYAVSAPELKFIEDFTEENNMPLHNAMAKVWRVYLHHRTTDYWGPIIYSEFGNGETSIAYDSQEYVYMDFFTTLDEAVSILESESGGNAYGSNDLVYGGNVNSWLRFANSLRLRVAMRIVYVMPEKAQEEAEKAVTGGVMMDNSDNAYVATNEDSYNEYSRVTDWGEFRMSASMESVLKGYEDPRLEVYFAEAVNGGYHGLRNGIPPGERNADIVENNSNMHEYWQDTVDAPIPILRAAEVYFLRAEGAIRGWQMGGTAQELYEEGIRQSLGEYQYEPIPTSEYDDYISSSNTPMALDYENDSYDIGPLTDIPVEFQEGANLETRLEQIITQKWIGLYPDGWEAWAEYRRTRYPKLYPIVQSLNSDLGEGEIFRRMTFVTDEYDNNTEATNAAVNLLNGPDRNDTRLWWDAKP